MRRGVKLSPGPPGKLLKGGREVEQEMAIQTDQETRKTEKNRMAESAKNHRFET